MCTEVVPNTNSRLLNTWFWINCYFSLLTLQPFLHKNSRTPTVQKRETLTAKQVQPPYGNETDYITKHWKSNTFQPFSEKRKIFGLLIFLTIRWIMTYSNPLVKLQSWNSFGIGNRVKKTSGRKQCQGARSSVPGRPKEFKKPKKLGKGDFNQGVLFHDIPFSGWYFVFKKRATKPWETRFLPIIHVIWTWIVLKFEDMELSGNFIL